VSDATNRRRERGPPRRAEEAEEAEEATTT